MRGETSDLSFVEVSDRIERGGHVPVEGPVTQEEFRLIACAEYQGLQAGGVVVEDRHPLPSHLVSAADVIRIRERREIRVNLRGNVHLEEIDPELLGDEPSMGEALGARGLVGHAHPPHVSGAHRRCREAGSERRVYASRESDDHPMEAGTPHFALNKAAQDLGAEIPVQGEFRRDDCGIHRVPLARARMMCSSCRVIRFNSRTVRSNRSSRRRGLAIRSRWTSLRSMVTRRSTSSS